jgi:alcohol dehydrogenase, propanol-preferring
MEKLPPSSPVVGVSVDGGFATHVLVPHQRYLLDYAPLPANRLMCCGSGGSSTSIMRETA